MQSKGTSTCVGVPRTEAIVRLHETILSHKDWLPPELDVGEPLVKAKGIDDVPIVALTLWTKDPAMGAYDLERVAHAVEVELKRVPGTREVATIGGPGRVVQVLLDPEKLSAHGLSASDLRRALRAANAASLAGTLVRGNETIYVETGEFLQTAKAVRDLVVGVHDGLPVYLGDVARVEDGPPPRRRREAAGASPQCASSIFFPVFPPRSWSACPFPCPAWIIT